MKAKKKSMLGPNGLKGFFLEHVEKIVLVGGRLYRIAPKESALESIYRQSAAVATA